MTSIPYIILLTVLANNVVFVRFADICPLVGSGKTFRGAAVISAATGVTMVGTSLLGHLVNKLILVPLEVTYLQTVVFLFLAACFAQAAENYLRKNKPDLYGAGGIYISLVAVNSAVLSTCTSALQAEYSIGLTLVYSLGVAAGFALSMFLFAGVMERLKYSPLPKCFRGTPAAFITASIISLAFMGFSGVINGIFGM